MITVGKVISHEVKNGLRIVKALFLGKNDVRTSVEATAFGDDAVAPKDWRALRTSVGRVDNSVIIGYINKNHLDTLASGEKRIFSVDGDGELSQQIILRNDGTMEIGGDADFMVRYSELETAFNQLKDDFDAHKHDGVVISVSGGSGAPAVGVTGESGAPTATTSADISGAKIEEIKTS